MVYGGKYFVLLIELSLILRFCIIGFCEKIWVGGIFCLFLFGLIDESLVNILKIIDFKEILCIWVKYEWI